MTTPTLPTLKIKSVDDARRCHEFLDFLFGQANFVLPWAKDVETRRMTRPAYTTWKLAAQSERTGALDTIADAKAEVAGHPFAVELHRLMDAITERLAELNRSSEASMMIDRLASMGYAVAYR